MCTKKRTRYSYWQNIKLPHYGQKMKKNENFDKKWKKMRCHEKNEKNEKKKKKKKKERSGQPAYNTLYL